MNYSNSSSSSESFILCTHPLPSPAPSTSIPPPIVSTINYIGSSSSKRDTRLCVVASGIGLGVYNLADQTPLSSLTLGPSFRPTSSAVARTTSTTSATSIKVKGIRKTWVGSGQGNTGELWSWTEEERKDGSIEGVATKVVYPTNSATVAISAPKSLPDQLLLLSADGSLSLVSEADLSPIVSLPSTTTTSESFTQTLNVHHAISTLTFLPPSIKSLIPNPSRAHLIFIVRTFKSRASSASLVEIGKKSFKKTKRPSSAAVIEAAEVVEEKISGEEAQSEIEVILVDPEVKEENGTHARIISFGKVIVNGTQVGVSEDGFVSAISSDGSLKSYRLEIAGSIPAPADYFELFLPNTPETSPTLTLTLVKSLQLSRTTLSRTNTTILPLHSSFLLLVSLRPSTKSSPTSEEPPMRIVVLIWDIRVGAIASESDISIPAAALPTSSNSTSLSLSLSYLSKQNVSLVVTPTSGTTGRSVIFILPLNFLPAHSNLATVIGKHNLTSKYLEGIESTLELALTNKREPIHHPKTGKGKLEFLEQSRLARVACLQALVKVLGNGVDGVRGERSVEETEQADEIFEKYLEEERERLRVYNGKKSQVANAKEKERRLAAIEEKEGIQVSTQKYRTLKKRIEVAIKEAGPKAIWSDVTSKRIKGVSDIYRYKYYEVRKAAEIEKGAEVVDKKVERALKFAERAEPNLPSLFVTAILRSCFPGELESEADIASTTSTSTAKVYRHPTGIISFFLDKRLIGEGTLDGGVTRYLARAGDWPNVMKALRNLNDIRETTSATLLKTVVTQYLSTESLQNRIEVDTNSNSLPRPIPALHLFLTSFVESPSTPSVLRQALKKQLTAVEVLPVLEILDGWLGWWASRGGGGGKVENIKLGEEDVNVKSKRLPVDPFVIVESSEVEESSPPRVEEILPLVQGILDAHFVTLLLQRQSHVLLRRLAAHIATHVALSTDLSSLIGALSIYQRAKHDQIQITAATKLKAKTTDRESLAEKRVGGATSAARVAAQEKHAEVGEYEVDKFWL